MKLYFKLISITLFFLVWVGFIGPYCVSGNTELIIGYTVVSIFLLPFSFKLLGRRK